MSRSLSLSLSLRLALLALAGAGGVALALSLAAPGQAGSQGASCEGQAATTVTNNTYTGSAEDEVVVGDASAQKFQMWNGDDVVCAGGGDDTVSGGHGGDELYAEGGEDVINGRPGVDHMDGGPRNPQGDRFDDECRGGKPPPEGKQPDRDTGTDCELLFGASQDFGPG